MTEFDKGAYEQALDVAKNRIDQLSAEAEKLKDNVRMLTQSNQTLRIANSELQKYIDTHKHTEGVENVSDASERECDGDCENCDRAEECDKEDGEIAYVIGKGEKLDEAVDGLVRSSLRQEGMIEAYKDVINTMCAWLLAAEDPTPEEPTE